MLRRSCRRARARALVALAALPLVASAAVGLGCSNGPRPRDVAGDRRPRFDEPDAAAVDTAIAVREPPRVVAEPTVVGKKPRVLARASTRALALDATNIYYGDNEDDGIYAMPKAGGEPLRLARHAPVAGALALDGDSITWIGSPGDAVLRVSIHGGQPTTLRDRGIFSDVATAHGDVFITEAIGAGGALLRVTGATAARLASFDGPPRAVMADATHTYVITPTRVFRTAHVRAELETIATGTGFSFAEMTDAFLFVVAEIDRDTVIARIPKSGGPMTTLARDARNAPLEVTAKEVLYFDAQKPQLRAVPMTADASSRGRVVSEDEAFASPTAIEADEKTIYIACGLRESGVIMTLDAL